MPDYPSRRDPLSADWARDVVRAIRQGAVTAGHGLRETQTSNGKIISLIREPVHVPREEEHYPYGPRSAFGIRFNNTGITVYSGVYYHAGVAYEWPDPAPGVQTLTGLTDGQYVCLKIVNPGAGATQSIVALATRSDTDGNVIRVLCRVTVADGAARLKKWYGGGIELGAMGRV